MEENYWIVDDWLIFKPEFNDKLDDYYDIISKYRDIGFLYGNAVEHFDILAHYLSTAIQVP